MQRVFFFPDIHAPYHDERAFKLACEACAYFNPHVVFTLGDLIDNYCVSQHEKDPGRKRELAWEASVARDVLRDIIKAAPEAKRIFIEGNHETRLPRHMAKVPELEGLITVEKLLQLKDFGFHYSPYKESYRIGKLLVTHDFGGAGKTAHLKGASEFGANVVIGHVHSMGVAYSGNIMGERHVSASFGWLGDVNTIDYMHRDKAKKDWQLGFGLGYLDDNGNVDLVPVPIYNNRARVRGKILRG